MHWIRLCSHVKIYNYKFCILCRNSCLFRAFLPVPPAVLGILYQKEFSLNHHDFTKSIHTSMRLNRKGPGGHKSTKGKEEIIDLNDFFDIFDVDLFLKKIENIESSLAHNFSTKFVLRPSLFTFEQIEIQLPKESQMDDTLTLNMIAQISMTQTHVSIQPVDWDHAETILDALRVHYPQSSASKDESTCTILIGLIKLTKEYRQNLAEKAKKAVAAAKEEVKVAVKLSLKEIKKREGFDADSVHHAQLGLYSAQKIVNKKFDDLLKQKVQQLMND